LELRIVAVKTDRSRRPIRLPQVAVNALLRRQERQKQERQFAGEHWKETGHVFTTTVDTPLDGPTVTHRLQHALKDANLRRLRFHDLRHTCATLLLAQGVHPRLIMEILGQSQISITMNLCAHVIPTMQAEVTAQMDEILTPQPVAARVAATAESGKVN
jgi:integrase